MRTFRGNEGIQTLGDAASAVLTPVVVKDKNMRTYSPTEILGHDDFAYIEQFLPEDPGVTLKQVLGLVDLGTRGTLTFACALLSRYMLAYSVLVVAWK